MGLYVIAEAGSCHEGELARAERLCHAAANAGANAVKFQYWSSPLLMRLRRNVSSQVAYDEGSIKAEWLPAIKMACQARKIDFLCTVYLEPDIGTLAPYVDGWKVSSFEAMDTALIQAIPRGKPLYISTGMCSDLEVDKIKKIRSCTLLHCVSAYPVPFTECGLARIRDGYSDHTKILYTGGLAVARGARVIEVHFMLEDTGKKCPDYCVSLDCQSLKWYIRHAKDVAIIMENKPTAREDAMKAHRVKG